MDIFSGTKLSAMVSERPKLFQELLPKLIKKLILCNSNNVKNIRMPSKDDNWSPGFDGIVESEESTLYLNNNYHYYCVVDFNTGIISKCGDRMPNRWHTVSFLRNLHSCAKQFRNHH